MAASVLLLLSIFPFPYHRPPPPLSLPIFIYFSTSHSISTSTFFNFYFYLFSHHFLCTLLILHHSIFTQYIQFIFFNSNPSCITLRFWRARPFVRAIRWSGRRTVAELGLSGFGGLTIERQERVEIGESIWG